MLQNYKTLLVNHSLSYGKTGQKARGLRNDHPTFNRKSSQRVYKPLLLGWWLSPNPGNKWEFRPPSTHVQLLLNVSLQPLISNRDQPRLPTINLAWKWLWPICVSWTPMPTSVNAAWGGEIEIIQNVLGANKGIHMRIQYNWCILYLSICMYHKHVNCKCI